MLVKKNYLNKSNLDYSIAIGNFDGIHLGHKFLLDQLKEAKKTKYDRIGILTFNPHPIKILYPERWKKNLIRFRTKFRLLKNIGIDIIFVIPFNKEFRSLSSKEFIEKILIKGIKVKNIFVGEDFKYGRGRQGSIEELSKYSKKSHFNLFYYKKRKLNGEIFSSSAIRNYIIKGDMIKSSKLLGYKWEVEGIVVKGDARGRYLGFPTANINYNYQIAPSNGVYACWAKIENEKKWRMAAISTGVRPHFKGEKKILEVHLIKFSGNLYNKNIRVAFIEKIRNEERFNNEKELILQMKKDCIEITKILKSNLIVNDNEN